MSSLSGRVGRSADCACLSAPEGVPTTWRRTPAFTEEIAKYYKNHIPCNDLLSVDDIIYKVAVCDLQGTEKRAKPALDAIMGDKLNVQVSGPIWMDVMSAGVNKGSALKQLSELLGIDRSNVMAFGDYFNDAECCALPAGVSQWRTDTRT